MTGRKKTTRKSGRLMQWMTRRERDNETGARLGRRLDGKTMTREERDNEARANLNFERGIIERDLYVGNVRQTHLQDPKTKRRHHRH